VLKGTRNRHCDPDNRGLFGNALNRPVKSLLITLWLGLRLQVLLPPPASQRIRPAAHFWLLLILQIASTVLIAWMYAPAAAVFDPMGVQSDAFLAILTLGSAALAATVLKRPVLAWSLAVLWTAAGLWLGWIWVLLEWLLASFGIDLAAYPLSIRLVLLSWWLLILRRSLDGLAPDAGWAWPGVVALAAALVSGLPALMLPLANYYEMAYQLPVAYYDEYAPPWPLRSSPEVLLAGQPALVDHALAKLKAQDPQRTDGYLLAFGGDGSETVFRNEVDYVRQLFAQRFGMQGRTLGLLNHPETTDKLPLASLTNLRSALKGMSEVMDPEEDLLFLFMTSHGSSDHQLYVDLLGLPLDQIDPQQLRLAIDDSGIRWKVLVVSACYSGGFIDALTDSTTLVITAAREDRSSFGCGVDSDFTYFGRAFFIDALNQTADFLLAFDLAKERIAEREAIEELDPSEPQIASTPLIEARLNSWAGQLELGPELAWSLPDLGDSRESPAEPASDRSD